MNLLVFPDDKYKETSRLVRNPVLVIETFLFFVDRNNTADEHMHLKKATIVGRELFGFVQDCGPVLAVVGNNIFKFIELYSGLLQPPLVGGRGCRAGVQDGADDESCVDLCGECTLALVPSVCANACNGLWTKGVDDGPKGVVARRFDGGTLCSGKLDGGAVSTVLLLHEHERAVIMHPVVCEEFCSRMRGGKLAPQTSPRHLGAVAIEPSNRACGVLTGRAVDTYVCRHSEKVLDGIDLAEWYAGLSHTPEKKEEERVC